MNRSKLEVNNKIRYLVLERRKDIMKKIIIISFVTHIMSVMALEQSSYDHRYPIDARVVHGVFNESNFITVYYESQNNDTTINYFIEDGNRSCHRSYNIDIDENYVFAKTLHVLPLYQDRILFVPTAYDSKFEEYSLKFVLLDFSQCQSTVISLPTKEKSTDFKITKYFDSFDIYYKDLFTCKDSYCEASYDYDGKQISTSPSSRKVESNKSVPLVTPVTAGIRSNKDVVFEFTEGKTIAKFIESDNTTILAEIADTEFTPKISTSNNLISLTYRLNFANLNLKQFDLKGNLKFEKLVKYGHLIRTAVVYNAPDGTVYVIASECDRDHCNDEQNAYTVKKFDEHGNEVGSLLFKPPLPGIIEDLSFYEKEDSYCLNRAQLSLGVSGAWQFKKMDFVANCFNDKDFS